MGDEYMSFYSFISSVVIWPYPEVILKLSETQLPEWKMEIGIRKEFEFLLYTTCLLISYKIKGRKGQIY